jgi:uncharacterized protein
VVEVTPPEPETQQLRVVVDGEATVTAILYRATVPNTPAALILAHGAGAGQHSPFMTTWARELAALGLEVVTFNFLYTEQRRRLPDRAPLLEACYRAVVAQVRLDVPSARDALFIGGKSMGGRMATHIAAADADLPVQGLVLLGYPLHPPGRPEQRRDAHLPRIARPMLFVQGSRDTFGTPQELEPVLARLSPAPVLHVVEGGDHSFKVARAGAARQVQIDDEVRRRIAGWIADTRASMRR